MLQSGSLIEELQDTLAERICTACRYNEYDGQTGNWNCSACDGDWTEKSCAHYNEWAEIEELLNDTEKTIEEITRQADDTGYDARYDNY